MKDMSRALRRHHALRLKRARRFFFSFDQRTDPRRLGMVLHTATPCSCWMCRNPRSELGLTRQESLHRISLAEEMQEIGID